MRQLTALPTSNLLQNNQHVFRLLTEGTSVSENRATGEKSPAVRFIDFERVENNRFMAVCQFKVRILGAEHHIVPDVVLFVNGLPVVAIEAKSPRVKDALPEAIDQLLRYSEQRGAKGQCGAVCVQPVFGGDLPQRSQVWHHHHAQREAFLPLLRPVPAHAGCAGARHQ